MYDIIVIGGGPAGISAAVEAEKSGASVLLIEREEVCGGILKQCIHDGFGAIRYKQIMTGPEYALKELANIDEDKIDVLTATYVTDIEKKETIKVTLVNNEKGLFEEEAHGVVLATGCRERTARQIFINGSRPAGVMTAGCAQHLVNIEGYLPSKRCVILGSGDIGLIMARRLTLEGTKVVGVYEIMPTPSGLSRNIVQCLNDYDIPLHLSKTVTRVFGADRVEAIEIASVDENLRPIAGTEERIECDALILSVGLIPENEIADILGVEICRSTKGPVVNQDLMTSVEGVFSCGNALHVNDLVDYVSESGEIAGREAALYAKNKKSGLKNKDERQVSLEKDDKLLYVVPQFVSVSTNEDENDKITIYFRSRTIQKDATIFIYINGKEAYKKKYKHLKSPEMECLHLDLKKLKLKAGVNDIRTVKMEMEV